MVNRLILNLSYTSNTRDNSEFGTRSGLEPPAFAVTSIGNFGGYVSTLHDNWDDEVFKDETEMIADSTQFELGPYSLPSSHSAGAGLSNYPRPATYVETNQASHVAMTDIEEINR